MRHGKKLNHLSRKSAHRKAMLSNMACSLVEHKRIHTTVAKAKALRVYVEPLLTKSKTDSTHSRRIVFGYLQSKDTVTELFRDVAPKIADRPGGYTRIIRIGNRLGDNAEMCMIELVDFNELMLNADKPEKKTTRRSRRGGGTKAKASTDTSAEKKTETKKDAPKAEAKKDDAPKAETKKEDAPKAEAKKEAPKKEAKKDESKTSSKKETTDDLTEIKGIGPVHAKELKNAGFTSFEQLSSLTAKDIEKIAAIDGVSAEMVETEEWKEQATALNNFKKLLGNLGTANADQKDALTEITGIGEVLEKDLNEVGVYTYEQISKILVKDMEYLSAIIGVTRNKIESEEWVKQAKALAKKEDKEAK